MLYSLHLGAKVEMGETSSFPGKAESTRACFYFLKAVSLLTETLVLQNTCFNKIFPGYIIPLLKIEVYQFASYIRYPSDMCWRDSMA